MKSSDLALALLANLAWAFNFIAAKIGVDHFPPLFFTGLRFAVVLLVLLPFLRIAKGQMKAVLRLGLLLGIGHFSLMFGGLAAAENVSSIAIIVQLYVPFSALLALVFLGEHIGWRRITGISLAFFGVVIIGFDPIVFNHLWALVLTTGAALVMAIASIMMRSLKGVGVFQLQAWIGLIATPGLFTLSWLFEEGQFAAVESATWTHYAAAIYTALGASIVGHGLIYYLLQRYPVSIVTPLTLISPIIAVFFGVTLLGDDLTWKLLLGGCATLAGVLIIALRSKKAPAQTEPG